MTNAAQLNLSSRLLADDRQSAAIESRVAKYLRRRSGVSLVELARDIPGFAGGQTWGSSEHNIVIWADMSVPAIAAMKRLVSSGQIVPTASTWLVYSFDGGVLDMPIADDVEQRYLKPHWIPTVFSSGEEAA